MSVVKYPETMTSKEVQIWDNAAFDNGESEDLASIKFSWSTMNPSSMNLSQSLESDSTKENLSPSTVESPVSKKSFAPINPLQTNTSLTNTKRSNPISKVGSLGKKENLSDERNLDLEIKEIEKEIDRLSSKLETLRLEKAKMNAKEMEKRGRIVAAKFKDPTKQSTKSSEEQIKIEESMCLSAKLKTPRRGLTLGPAEIMRGVRRGISLGPAEIYSATNLKQLGKEMCTPVQPSSSRRKSCYWKLQDIDELRVTKQRGKSLSLSPKSRSKIIPKSHIPKQSATTIGSKKMVKKEEGLGLGLGLGSSIQPKKLFAKEGEKSAKQPMKFGRVVASRYGQISNGVNSAMKEVRKRSLPENEEAAKKSERKRASLTGKSEERENRVKKRWEIPNIKTLRFANESPRDSGQVKRVAELVGKKSYFNVDDNDSNDSAEEEEEEESVCQALDFAQEKVSKEYLKIKVLRRLDESPRDSGAAKRVAELVGRKSFFDDEDHEMPVFSFEEEDAEDS